MFCALHRKHAQSMRGSGLQNPAARLFSNPAGDYGSMVNERVGAGNWDSGQELGDTWASRNAFSYGRCVHPGKLPRHPMSSPTYLLTTPLPLHCASIRILQLICLHLMLQLM